MEHTNSNGYLLLEGKPLRDYQEMVHGKRFTAHRQVQSPARIMQYTPVGMVKRLFGFFI